MWFLGCSEMKQSIFIHSLNYEHYISDMKKNLAIAKAGLKTSLQYRFHFFTSLISAPVSLIVYWFLWKAIFSYSGEDIINSFTLTEMINYFTISIVIGIIIYSDIESWLSQEVVHGEIIDPLLRPVSLFNWYYFSELGIKSFGLIIQVIPIMLIGLAFFSLKFPSIVYLIFFLISVILASIINFLMSYAVGISSFWLKKISGIKRMKKAVINFLGGALIPLTFFPLWFQSISKFLPFEYTRSVPINIFIGKSSQDEIILSMLIQIIWIALLASLTLFMTKKAIKKFTGEGT